MVNKEQRSAVAFAPWAEFSEKILRWGQGEHVALIGPTGQGKTTLALNLLPMRKYMIAFATKPRDPVMNKLVKKRGYALMKEWQPYLPTLYPRRVLWPDAKDLHSTEHQREEFGKAMAAIYSEGGWGVYLDECWYMINQLKLSAEVKTYLLQARSLRISLLVASQRPTWIPVEVFDQSTHLFFFRDNDRRNLDRISGVGYLDANFIRNVVARLASYQALYVNTRTGYMITTKAPKVG
jgi:hypothetical protein